MIELIGYIAAIIGTFMMLPQVLRWYQTRDMKSVSWWMIVMYILNCILWTIYGLAIDSYPLVLANGMALIIGIFQAFLKYKYK